MVSHAGDFNIVPAVAEPFVLIAPLDARSNRYELAFGIYDVKVGLALAV